MILAVLFGLSGGAALTYEVTWMRQLGLVFGTSNYAVSTVLTAFMAGLALGSVGLGPLADRSRHPLRLYARLETGIALSALFVLLLMPRLDALYVVFYQRLHPGQGLLTLLRWALSSLLLLPATVCMGGTFPVMAKVFVRRETRLGQGVGVLYGANTLGAVLGSFLSGFFFIERWGLRATLLGAIALNLLVALGAFLLARRWGGTAEESLREEAGLARKDEGAGEALSKVLILWTVWLIGLSGFVALACEVIWSRLLSMVLDVSIYAFSTMLTTLLCGLAIGGFLAGRLADRVRSRAGALALTEMGIGLMVLYQLRLFPLLPIWSSQLYQRCEGMWWSLTGVEFLLSFAFLLGPTILMGMAFPLAARVYVRGLPTAGCRIGRVYAANTVGGILGSVLAGFLLLSWLGTRGSLLLGASLALGGGLVLLVWAPGWSWDRKALGGIGSLAVAGALALTAPSWSRVQWVISPTYRNPANRILYFREGATGTVTAFDAPSGIRYVEVNGRNASLTDYASRQTFRLLGHLPLLLHPYPRQVLVVAFGAGMTLGAVGRHPVEHIDCVEICREVLGAAPLFAPWNYRVWEDPRVQIHIEDGRNYLLRTDQRYDCITADPLHPAAAGNGNLYSREYFQLCRARLAPGGLVCQWIPVTGLFPEHFRRIAATFHAVFPECSLWFVGDYALLLGTSGSFRIDWEQFQARFSNPRIRDSLAEVRLGNPLSLLKCLVMGPTAFARYGQGVPPFVDDHPLLEFAGPKLEGDRAPQILSELMGFEEPLLPFLGLTTGELRAAPLLERLGPVRRHYMQGRWASFQGLASTEREIEAYEAALVSLPEDEDVRFWLEQARRNWEYYLIPQGTARMARGDYSEAEGIFLRLLRKVPHSGAAYFHLGRIYLDQGWLPDAIDALKKATHYSPERAEPFQLLGKAYLQHQEYEKALRSCQRALQLDPNLSEAQATLAEVQAARSRKPPPDSRTDMGKRGTGR